MPREQEQFLEVVDRDTAERRWREVVRPSPLGPERVDLSEALGRVLAADVSATVDVPAFDRSNVDGYAVQAADTHGATEERPRSLRLDAEEITPGVVPGAAVTAGLAIAIATGGMLPRGADAVLMVEHARTIQAADRSEPLVVAHPVASGSNVSFAGTDMARGELVLRRGTVLSARETGVLAALGAGRVEVVARPRVAVLSTGNEIVDPRGPLPPASVWDANTTLLADAARELGCQAVPLGTVPDDEAALDAALDRALAVADVVLLSGGTSKGGGDLSYRVLERRSPGVVVHGVALKPGKPVCLGAIGQVPVAILPGFPTSAIFTFHEFVAPILRRLAGLGATADARGSAPARMAMRCNSERGRTEYLLVNLVAGRAPGIWTAYPMGKGSGSVTAFSRADGFVTVPRQQEYLEAGEPVEVTLLGRAVGPADLVVIGSHCVGLDLLLGRLSAAGPRVKTMWVGSQGGLAAVGRGEADVAGVHLLDPATGTYNTPFLPAGVRLLRGYDRMQGLVFRAGDGRFEARPVAEAVDAAAADPACLMVNRNRGSGTRVLIDGLLKGRRPAGAAVEVRSHNAVAAAVVQGRADWGVAIGPVAREYGLGFTPLRVERYDFAVPADRWDRPAVARFRDELAAPDARRALAALGFGVEGT